MEEWKSLEVNSGDRIQPAWNRLVRKGDESEIVIGGDTRVRSLPGGGIHVVGSPPKTTLTHPWRMGFMNEDARVVMREGTVSGELPWVSEDYRIGEMDDEGALATIQLQPKDEGFSFVALGVNIRNSQSERAEIDTGGKSTWEQLRIAQIDEMPAGFGSGGVLEDKEGWAWYPLVRIRWEDEQMAAQFQVVRHNLGHLVVESSDGAARHFFPPV